jgi:hypothetical protein
MSSNSYCSWFYHVFYPLAQVDLHPRAGCMAAGCMVLSCMQFLLLSCVLSQPGDRPRDSQQRNKPQNTPRTADAPVSGVLIGWPNGLLLQLP